MIPGPFITFRRKPANIDQDSLEKFAAQLHRGVAKKREFHCLITGDAEIQRLNREYRRKNYATDVLSFPGADGYLGDIAISLARARAQAREFGHSTDDELRILLLHGLLHLSGMDHETDSGEMARTEERLRKQFGLPAGLIARAA